MRKAAVTALEMCKSAGRDVMDGLGGHATNLLSGGTAGALRAAQVKGRAMEAGTPEATLPFSVRHPYLSAITNPMVGYLGGGLAGAGIGGLVGGQGGAALGSAIGAIAGGVGGASHAQHRAGQVQRKLNARPKAVTSKEAALWALEKCAGYPGALAPSFIRPPTGSGAQGRAAAPAVPAGTAPRADWSGAAWTAAPQQPQQAVAQRLPWQKPGARPASFNPPFMQRALGGMAAGARQAQMARSLPPGAA